MTTQKITNYTLISKDTPLELIESVKAHIKLGFQPYGNHSAVYDEEIECIFYSQAMVKYEKCNSEDPDFI